MAWGFAVSGDHRAICTLRKRGPVVERWHVGIDLHPRPCHADGQRRERRTQDQGCWKALRGVDVAPVLGGKATKSNGTIFTRSR